MLARTASASREDGATSEEARSGFGEGTGDPQGGCGGKAAEEGAGETVARCSGFVFVERDRQPLLVRARLREVHRRPPPPAQEAGHEHHRREELERQLSWVLEPGAFCGVLSPPPCVFDNAEESRSSMCQPLIPILEIVQSTPLFHWPWLCQAHPCPMLCPIRSPTNSFEAETHQTCNVVAPTPPSASACRPIDVCWR